MNFSNGAVRSYPLPPALGGCFANVATGLQTPSRFVMQKCLGRQMTGRPGFFPPQALIVDCTFLRCVTSIYLRFDAGRDL